MEASAQKLKCLDVLSRCSIYCYKCQTVIERNFAELGVSRFVSSARTMKIPGCDPVNSNEGRACRHKLYGSHLDGLRLSRPGKDTSKTSEHFLWEGLKPGAF
jgi:hypothetical protein